MVIVHPEYAMLILEINNLKEQIANLVVERDMLSEYVCRNLQIDYMLKIGALEYKLMVAKNNHKKSLRKLEMVEEKLTKNLKVNLNSIEKKVNSEFKEKTKKEEEFSDDIDFAIEMTSMDLFNGDFIDEISAEYFKVQKLYNPIFDLQESPEKNKKYKKIEQYYRRHDYEKLHKLAKDYDEDDIFQDEISTLKTLKEKYVPIVESLQKQVRKIKNSFPYNQKIILEEENLCRRRKDSINREITEVNLETKKIDKKIENKLKKL